MEDLDLPGKITFNPKLQGADAGGLAICSLGLYVFNFWERGFESHLGHGFASLVLVRDRWLELVNSVMKLRIP